MDKPHSLYDAPKERCSCNDTGIGVWIWGDFLRACGFCEKGIAMAKSGWVASPNKMLSKDVKTRNG